ncbi:hypothetical protein GCM10010392_46870 [Streptomyces clavifer]|nr:hypothetical protein GCM10010392_46870 [Streptomyces clavifer]
MRGRALVEGDEFVRLRAGQVPSSVQKVVQAVPLGAVGGHEDVEIHGRLLLQAWVRTGPYCGGALRASLADCGPEGQGRAAKGGRR